MSNFDQPRVAKGTPKRGGQWSSKHTAEAGDVELVEDDSSDGLQEQEATRPRSGPTPRSVRRGRRDDFVEATRDQILDGSQEFRNQRYVEVRFERGGSGSLRLLSVDGDHGATTGYVQSERTGMLYAFRQVGQPQVRGWQTRIRLAPAEDTGDLAGTLRFDFGGDTLIGILPNDLVK